jgi:hypothetical protein
LFLSVVTATFVPLLKEGRAEADTSAYAKGISDVEANKPAATAVLKSFFMFSFLHSLDIFKTVQ